MNDGRDNSGAGTPAGSPRKPRIEVLRGAPAPSAAPPAADAREHVFGGAQPREPRGSAHIAPPPVQAGRVEHRETAVRRPGGGLLRSPLLLLALVALAVLIGAIWYASLQRGPDVVFDVPADPVRTETRQTPSDAPVSDYETPPNPGSGEAPSAAQDLPGDPAEPIEAAARTVAPPSVAEPRQAVQDAAPAEDAAPAGGAGAVATVRAFYSALSAGDGGSASQLVVPAKRRSGPLSAGALTRYYSSFRRPLRVRRIDAVDGDTVRVAYDYVLADGRLCRGTAAVDVVPSGDGGLVSGIRTQGPC
jgi:hypothetical protein